MKVTGTVDWMLQLHRQALSTWCCSCTDRRCRPDAAAAQTGAVDGMLQLHRHARNISCCWHFVCCLGLCLTMLSVVQCRW
jgi:hypothetical protein